MQISEVEQSSQPVNKLLQHLFDVPSEYSISHDKQISGFID